MIIDFSLDISRLNRYEVEELIGDILADKRNFAYSMLQSMDKKEIVQYCKDTKILKGGEND